jgi:hypothetical protein
VIVLRVIRNTFPTTSVNLFEIVPQVFLHVIPRLIIDLEFLSLTQDSIVWSREGVCEVAFRPTADKPKTWEITSLSSSVNQLYQLTLASLITAFIQAVNYDNIRRYVREGGERLDNELLELYAEGSV